VSAPGPRRVAAPPHLQVGASGRALYNVAVVKREHGMFIDLEGVRQGDRAKLLHGILGLAAEDWSVKYFRRLERYIVLSQPEEHRLAAKLGGEPHRERGRRARVEWLHHHFRRDVTIRTRAKGYTARSTGFSPSAAPRRPTGSRSGSRATAGAGPTSSRRTRPYSTVCSLTSWMITTCTRSSGPTCGKAKVARSQRSSHATASWRR